MNHKLSGISVLGIVMLLVSVLALADQAYAGAATWSAEPIPSTIDNVLGPAGIDVRDIAVAAGGTIIYAVPGDSIPDKVVYKSTSAGTSWTAIVVPIEADLVAVAPDDADTVAIANSSTPEVYLTNNGGSTWYTLGTPQESGGNAAAAIYDMAVSTASDGIRYIAVAGKEMGDVANMWYFNASTAVPAWKGTNSLTGFSSANETAAVAFSPNFPDDQVIVIITGSAHLSVSLQIFSLSYNTWNDNASFGAYPITIVSSAGITGLTSASLAMAPDYVASDTGRQTVFVGMAIDGNTAAVATSGVYRLINNNETALMTGTRIRSIAYNGANLVVGRYDTTTVYRCANPTATTPTVSPVSAMKEPGGVNRTVVAWAGSKVVAGTSGYESAFAASTNNGATFNDISLIDTAITNAGDVAVSADGGRVYFVTDDGSDLSLWRRDSTWKRILSQQGTKDYLVRLAPGDADKIYLAKKGATAIYYNNNGGDAEWLTRNCSVNVQDLAVQSADVVYALNSAGSVSKGTNDGLIWGSAVSTRLSSGATIVCISTGNLLVGSQDGYVAYSTDGNLSWTRIPAVLQSGAGRVQVIADRNFASNKIIYAASDTSGQNINKWQIGTSTEWADIFRNNVTGGIYGMATDEGTLYGLEFNSITGQSTLWRCLSPTSTTATSDNWSSITTTTTTDVDDTEVHLNATPRSLKVSSGKLWAVKTNGTDKLYSFTDILIEVSLLSPVPGFTNPINTITGIANDIPFSWQRLSESTEYELQVAYDKDFTIPVTTLAVDSAQPTVTVVVGPHKAGDAMVNFTTGTYYYWRVRTTQPLYGLYSETRSFVIKPLLELVPSLFTPANGSLDVSPKPAFSWNPVSGATEYEFMLSADAAMTSPVVDTAVKNAGFAMAQELDYGSTYFWQVRMAEPTQGDWSILANFTVEQKPAQPVPPVVVQQAPPPVVIMPTLPPITITALPPPAPPAPTPTPTVSNYIRVMVTVFAALLLVVIGLIARTITFRRFGAAEASQPITFAVESFLWMTSAGGKGGDQRLLSAEEERSLGRKLALRIKAIANDQPLYQKFPKDAASFLYLWSRYGSRDETNRYLARSFQIRLKNVNDFLKCYVTAPGGREPGPTRKAEFSRTQYDSVAEAVDPDKIYEALIRLYGPGLNRPEGEEFIDAPDKAVAYRFAGVHRLVKSEMRKSRQNGVSQ